jgi:hypothetical protein
MRGVEVEVWRERSQFALCLFGSVADPDPVGSGPFRSDPDPDVWDQIKIRILALINDTKK